MFLQFDKFFLKCIHIVIFTHYNIILHIWINELYGKKSLQSLFQYRFEVESS